MSELSSMEEMAGGEPFTVTRPWGRFDQLATNSEVTVKVITVRAGGRLSLQRHDSRDELWHVLDSGLVLTIGGVERAVDAGECVFVPRGTIHRICNSAETAARVVEVAYGQFDEDDIVRLSDDYGR